MTGDVDERQMQAERCAASEERGKQTGGGGDAASRKQGERALTGSKRENKSDLHSHHHRDS